MRIHSLPLTGYELLVMRLIWILIALNSRAMCCYIIVTVEAQLTGKAKQLEEDHAKGMSEAERLREVRHEPCWTWV